MAILKTLALMKTRSTGGKTRCTLARVLIVVSAGMGLAVLHHVTSVVKFACATNRRCKSENRSTATQTTTLRRSVSLMLGVAAAKTILAGTRHPPLVGVWSSRKQGRIVAHALLVRKLQTKESSAHAQTAQRA